MNWYLLALKKYATFKGRSNPAEFWFYQLFVFLITLGLLILDIILGSYNEQSDLGLLSGLFSLAMIIPTLSVGVRRLHDINKSGWLYLMILIPLIGIILLIIWWAKNGDQEDNKYGVNPLKNINNNTVVDSISIDQLEKLKVLKDEGILTEEEFNSQKRLLLNSLDQNYKNQHGTKDGSYWLPVPSMILGIIVILASLDEGSWDKDSLTGAFVFIILSLSLGISSLIKQELGKGMAISGITLSIITTLFIIGTL